MYCKHCGKEIADDSKFCRYCGKAQDSTNEVQPEKPVGSIEPQSGSQSIKVELVTPKKVSEDGVRKGVLTILKEIGLIGSTYFIRGLPTQKLLAKYRRATVHYSK